MSLLPRFEEWFLSIGQRQTFRKTSHGNKCRFLSEWKVKFSRKQSNPFSSFPWSLGARIRYSPVYSSPYLCIWKQILALQSLEMRTDDEGIHEPRWSSKWDWSAKICMGLISCRTHWTGEQQTLNRFCFPGRGMLFWHSYTGILKTNTSSSAHIQLCFPSTQSSHWDLNYLPGWTSMCIRWSFQTNSCFFLSVVPAAAWHSSLEFLVTMVKWSFRVLKEEEPYSYTEHARGLLPDWFYRGKAIKRRLRK